MADKVEACWVQSLVPCATRPPEHVFWELSAETFLAEGIVFQRSGLVAYAPTMIPCVEAGSVRVQFSFDAYDPNASYQVALCYEDASQVNHILYTTLVHAVEQDAVIFDIPIKHVKPGGWFLCSVQVSPMTPIDNPDDRTAAQNAGLDEPMLKILLRGACVVTSE